MNLKDVSINKSIYKMKEENIISSEDFIGFLGEFARKFGKSEKQKYGIIDTSFIEINFFYKDITFISNFSKPNPEVYERSVDELAEEISKEEISDGEDYKFIRDNLLSNCKEFIEWMKEHSLTYEDCSRIVVRMKDNRVDASFLFLRDLEIPS